VYPFNSNQHLETDCQPGEVLEEAVRRYVAACRLERFEDRTGQRARDKGIWEEDVPRLVEKVRRDNAERGHEHSGWPAWCTGAESPMIFCKWRSTARSVGPYPNISLMKWPTCSPANS